MSNNLVVEALEDAIDKVGGEYCSHPEPHGDFKTCWCAIYFRALASIGWVPHE